ncbi:MAG: tRNA (adenosine(37)-N6)-threonylcarbamoyltransferase complex ATPase subunit type 1 TsaE [Chitinophagales bacterium]|nr:tRNA (adenosine(37)-N6)-threonylcarbamoyltransferase complex ATPase subunit type 1 TsaE [Chitinophagales bacterium]
MNELHITVSSEAELPDVAKQILAFAKGRKLFAFYAQMGAGKTTLIKEMCRALGSYDKFSSPTYSIVNEYKIETTGESAYHIDLYRIETTEEFVNTGIGEYTTGNHYCFVEWAERAEGLLPDEAVKINIQTQGNIRNVAIFMS